MNTQRSNTDRYTDGVELGRLPRLHSTILPTFQPSILLALLAAGMLAQTARGATDYYVATNGLDTGAYDGKSWAQPFLTISNGVAKATAAGDGSTVTVSNGTYAITAQIAIGAAITVRSFGGGVNGGLANASNTIVSVSGGSGNRRVFNITANATVDGFTARDAAGTINGGGAYMNNGVVQNCILRNNRGDTMYGCGVYLDGGGLVQGCMISDNGYSDRVIGGGVYMNNGGTVSNCLITANKSQNGGSHSGGVYMNAGTLVSCQIIQNSSPGNAVGGVYANGASAIVRNCLIYGNSAAGIGGGVQLDAGTIESCTIVGNSASSGGGIYRGNNGTVRNCVVVNNTSGDANKNAYSGISGWTYNCTTNPVVAGTGCTSGDPLFRNYAEGNYQLSAGSLCIDTGTNQTWMVAGVKDMAGNERNQDGDNNGSAITDMGAYEYSTTLSCDFLANPRALIASPTTYQAFGPAPLTVQFTGWADGTNLTGLVYRWDFEGDSNWTDWVSYYTTSHVYNTAGAYSPKLQVTNSAAEVAEKIKSAYVSAGSTHYVKVGGNDANTPFTSWETAAATIQAAINAVTLNGSQVIISNGTYTTASALTIGLPLTVRSFQGGLSGASNTVVQGGGAPHFTVSSPYAELEGLTIRQGSRIVTISAGLVRNCIIRDGSADNIDGIGVYMTGGTLSNCVVTSNTGGSGGGASGSPVYISAGSILYSWITDNTANNGSGGGVQMAGASALLRNCLVARNVANAGVGGGVCMINGTIESCTIVANTAKAGSNAGGGVYRANGTVRNCVVYLNNAPNNPANANYYATAGFEYSCSSPTPPPTSGAGNILAGVTFQNPAANDFRLKASAAVDAGTTLSWMTGALDLAGSPRIINGVVDMGAYEYAPGALECGLAANVTTVLAPSDVVFTATVAGSNLTSLAYAWDFGDGNTTNGSGLSVVPHLYANPGLFTVNLTVTNGVGEIAAAANANYIAAWATNAYVWTGSPSPTVPYTNWATAARLVGTAVAAAPAGVTLWATNGTYNEVGTITLSKRLAVRSALGGLSGASNTIVRAGAFPLFDISNGGVVVEGLTIRDALRGVNMTDGLVQNCIIRNNACDNNDGVGVSISGGTVSNCMILSNVGGNGGGAAGSPVLISAGSILYSWITDNNAKNGNGGGVTMVGASALLRNCVVARNLVNNGSGGGVYLAAGTIESCTITTNTANGAGGGVYRGSGTAGTVLNSIVYGNMAPNNATYQNFFKTSDAGITFTCTTNPVVAGAGCIADDPVFAGITNANYRLNTGSPCIDKGTNQTWMIGATDLDGVNARKLFGGVAGTRSAPGVDMGAYEFLFAIPKGLLFMAR